MIVDYPNEIRDIIFGIPTVYVGVLKPTISLNLKIEKDPRVHY